MQTLSKALRNSDGIGEALPSVFAAMKRKGWLLRRGQTVMIAAAPNVGKSMLALFMAIEINEPTLYISADTDEFTTMTRAAAKLSGDTINAVEMAIEAGAGEIYEAYLNELKDVRFVFDAAPSLEDIDQEVAAFNEVYGEPPALIVIDNLINIQLDDADEFRGLRLISAAMHQLSRATGACVIVLHHVTGEFEDGVEPPPRRALHGKISKFAETIFTAGRQGQMFGVACVKNRTGPADPLAGNAVWLLSDLSRMRFEDKDIAN